MARVFWDGEKIVATACEANIYQLTEFAEKYEAETLPAVNGYAFPRTKNSILDLSTLNQTAFDPSFEELLNAVNRSIQVKRNEIDSYNFPQIMYQFQKEAVAQMIKWNHNVLLASDMGCIDGDAIVTINRHGKSSNVTLKKMYDLFHNHIGIYTYEERPMYIRGFVGDRYGLNKVLDVVDSGVKHCIEITLDSGKKLRLTPDHVVFTKDGEIEAKDSLGCYIQVDNSYSKCNKKQKTDCVSTECKRCHTIVNLVKNPKARFFGYCINCSHKLSKHIGFGGYSEDVVEILGNDGYVYLRGKKFHNYQGRHTTNGVQKHVYVMEQHLGRKLTSGEIIHHKDGNKLNNDISNLEILTQSEHNRRHNELSNMCLRFNIQASYEKVISITDIGDVHVYDVKVEKNHNFLANKILVHNCGKTCMATVFLNKVNLYPALIVCPASLKFNWSIEVEKWSPGIRTCVVEGRDSYKSVYTVNTCKEADVIIINYDILGVDDKEAQKKEKERIKRAKEKGEPYRKAFIPVSGWVDVINRELKPKIIVCDECQYIESAKAVRTRAVTQIAVNKNVRKLFLSGTPFETRVSQFYTACHLLAPDMFPKEWDFKQRYCDPHYNGFGWEYKGASHVDELREKLSTFMIRHKKEDVLSQLPPKQKIPIYFDMDKKARAEYDKMEDELLAQDGLHQFAYLGKMKQALMEIKIEPVIQFIKDMLEVEDKLVVFTYHTAMYDTLMQQFGSMCVGINGSVIPFKRQEAVNKFQKDPNVKLFIGQVQAASTGITLTSSHTVVFAEWSNTCATMEQACDRICRIGQTADKCLIYYLIVKDTVDEAPLETLSSHYEDIQAVMNGDKNASFVDIDDSMIARVKKRKLMKNKESVQIEYN